MENVAGVVNRVPLIGEKAPAFEADTTQGKIKFPDDYKGKWVFLDKRRNGPTKLAN